MSVNVETRDLQTNEDLYRFSNANRVAPDPPRGVRVDAGTPNVVRWEKPTNMFGVTHYRVYLNSDDDDSLAYEISAGSTQVFVPQANEVLVSSYNAPMETESLLVRLGASILPIAGTGSGIASVQVLLTAATNTNITAVTATDGARLAVFVRQPLAGSPGTITWDGAKFKITPTNLAQTLGTWTVFEFAGRADGFWWLVTNYRTGATY